MKHLIVSLGAIVFAWSQSFAQSVGPTSVLSGSGSGSVGAHRFDWVVGPLVSSTYSTSSIVITPGALQPVDKPSSVPKDTYISDHLLVYPNPASDRIFLRPSFNSGGSFRVTLSDIGGKPLQTLEATLGDGNELQSLDCKALCAGTYILHVSFALAGKVSETSYRVQKVKW